MTAKDVNEALVHRRARTRSVEASDPTRAEWVAAALRKAFPLPPSGAFTDLLAAIDGPPSS